MGIFSAMWSEHCSYKHTRPLFAQFPTKADWVVQGPGENAGVVSIGDGWAVVFKIESHNHPSYVAPYDGAATGVGGLLRDIMAMGARPVGVKALLRSGSPESPATKRMIELIREGAATYAQACDVADLGTDWKSQASFATNPLVNVIVLGLVRIEDLMRSSAGQAGNLLVYYGRPTGSDGVAGAMFASKGMDEKTEAHPPAGDEKVGRDLLEATLRLIETKAIVGLQDMGAAGLTCSSFEMASQSGNGLQMDLDQTPADPDGLPAYELLLSERQERMLAAVSPSQLNQVLEILTDYPSLSVAVIGKVVEGEKAVIHYDGQVVGDLPVSLVVDGFLRIPLDGQPAKSSAAPLRTEVEEHAAVSVALKSGAQSASGLRVSRPRAEASACDRIEFPEIQKTVFLRTLSNGPEILEDPYACAKQLVHQAYDDLVAAGAKPLALSDGLNFGSPDKPAIAYQIQEAVRGLADACRELNVAVIGGNASLYNETQGEPILPQVFIGMVGVRG
jgi:phosphoribosylformylglycinamidine synthase